MPLAAALALSLLAASPAEPTFDLPGAFERLDDRVYAGSSAFVPLVGEGESPRELLAVWTEAGGRGGTLAVGRVRQPLELDGQTRAQVASAIASHFRTELGLEITVERPEIVGGTRSPRVQVRARTAEGPNARVVRFALFPEGDAYYVLAATYPPEREPELGPAISQAIESFAVSRAPREPDATRMILQALAFVAFAVLLVIGVRLRRRPVRP